MLEKKCGKINRTEKDWWLVYLPIILSVWKLKKTLIKRRETFFEKTLNLVYIMLLLQGRISQKETWLSMCLLAVVGLWYSRYLFPNVGFPSLFAE